MEEVIQTSGKELYLYTWKGDEITKDVGGNIDLEIYFKVNELIE